MNTSVLREAIQLQGGFSTTGGCVSLAFPAEASKEQTCPCLGQAIADASSSVSRWVCTWRAEPLVQFRVWRFVAEVAQGWPLPHGGGLWALARSATATLRATAGSLPNMLLRAHNPAWQRQGRLGQWVHRNPPATPDTTRVATRYQRGSCGARGMPGAYSCVYGSTRGLMAWSPGLMLAWGQAVRWVAARTQLVPGSLFAVPWYSW